MRRSRRFLSWSLFLGFLWAVGWAVFVYVRHTPRCTIAGTSSGGITALLSPDGSRLITIPGSGQIRAPGGWRVWDTRTGDLLHELFRQRSVGWLEKSPDRRHLAAWLGAKNLDDNELWLVDWPAGQHWRLDVKRVPGLGFKFSSGGRWLFASEHKRGALAAWGAFWDASPERAAVVNVATKEIVFGLREFPRSSNNDQRLFVQDSQFKQIEIWDPDSGKNLAKLAPADYPWDAPFISPDDRILLSWQDGEREIDAWDLETGKKRFRRELRQSAYIQPIFSPDSRALALWLRHNAEVTETELEMIDAKTGWPLWTFADPSGIAGEFSPDGSLCYVVHGGANKTLSMFESATGRILWTRRHFDGRFAGATGNLLHREDDSKPFKLLNARTGECVATAPLNFDPQTASLTFTPDNRQVAIIGWQSRNRAPYFWEEWLEDRWPNVFAGTRSLALVMATNSGRELFRANAGFNFRDCALSDDADTLVTVEACENPPENTFIIRIWDVSPTRAYLWAIGAAAGTGIVLLGLRLGWRKLTRRAASIQQAPPLIAPA
jgi:WD40 repeat protein